MKKPKIELTIIKEEEGYSAVGQWRNRGLATCGDSWAELQTMIVEMINLVFEDLNHSYTFEEISLKYDLPSFFAFYKVLNAKALAQRIGMHQSLLAQYIGGKKKPSPVQTRRILQGVHQIGRELSEVDFVQV